MTIALELPQTTDLLDPTAKLSSGFIKSLPIPVGLWCPSKLRNVAVDFNPLEKNFGALNGGITTVPGGYGALGAAWNLDGSTGAITVASPTSLYFTGPFSLFALVKRASATDDAAQPKAILCRGTSPFYALEFYQGNVYFGVNNAWLNTAATYTSTSSWYGLTGVWDGSNASIFVNDALAAGPTAESWAPSNSAGDFFIGYRDVGFNFNGEIAIGLAFGHALSASQVSTLYSCLRYGKPFPLFEPDTLYIDGPQTSTTLNLTSKSFVFSSSNSQASIQRNINTQSDSLSDSQGNITFTRDLKSTLDSRSFSSSATSVLRPINSIANSQSKSSAEETRQILSSSIIISQSFSSGKFALSAFINLESTVCAESFSYVEINLSRVLNSTGFVLSDLLAEITVKRNLSSIGLSLSDSISQETILRPLASENTSEAKDHAEISIERLLTSEVLSSSLAKGQFTTQLYTKFELLSYRRYSSQYFVQSGSVNDSGQ